MQVYSWTLHKVTQDMDGISYIERTLVYAPPTKKKVGCELLEASHKGLSYGDTARFNLPTLACLQEN